MYTQYNFIMTENTFWEKEEEKIGTVGKYLNAVILSWSDFFNGCKWMQYYLLGFEMKACFAAHRYLLNILSWKLQKQSPRAFRGEFSRLTYREHSSCYYATSCYWPCHSEVRPGQIGSFAFMKTHILRQSSVTWHHSATSIWGEKTPHQVVEFKPLTAAPCGCFWIRTSISHSEILKRIPLLTEMHCSCTMSLPSIYRPSCILVPFKQRNFFLHIPFSLHISKSLCHNELSCASAML